MNPAAHAVVDLPAHLPTSARAQKGSGAGPASSSPGSTNEGCVQKQDARAEQGSAAIDALCRSRMQEQSRAALRQTLVCRSRMQEQSRAALQSTLVCRSRMQEQSGAALQSTLVCRSRMQEQSRAALQSTLVCRSRMQEQSGAALQSTLVLPPSPACDALGATWTAVRILLLQGGSDGGIGHGLPPIDAVHLRAQGWNTEWARREGSTPRAAS